MILSQVRRKIITLGFERNWIGFLLFILSSLVFFRIAPFDPDPHHDGIQLAPVIGILEGKHVHGDLFEQYGPVWDWIKAIALASLGPELINLRYLAAMMASATCFMIYIISLRVINSHIVSLTLSMVWIFTSPAFNTINDLNFPLWPWPSLLLNLIILLLMNKFLSNFNKKDLRYQKLSAIFTSFLVTVCMFTRLQIGLLLILGISFIIFKYQLKNKVIVAYYVYSLIVFVALVCFYLASTNSMSFFFQQTVIGPLNAYVYPISTSYIFVNFCLGVIPFVTYLFVIQKLSKKRLPLKLASVVFILVFIFSTIIVGKFPIDFFLNDYPISRAILDIQSHSIIYFSFTFTCFFAIMYCIGFLKFRFFHSNRFDLKTFSKADRFLTIVLVFSLFSLVQAYPLQDIYHLWWASPTLLISSMYLLKLLGFDKKTMTSLSLACLIPIIAIGISSFVAQVQTPRKTADFGSLKGMQIQESRFGDFKTANDFFLKSSELDGVFNCPDGLFPVWTGEYRSTDGNYVNWSWNTLRSGGTSKGSPWYLCSNDSSFALDWAKTNNLSAPLRVVGPLNFSPWSTHSLYYFLRN